MEPRITWALCVLIFVFARTGVSAEAIAALAYPSAKRGAVVDDYNGVKVADPYRWMEDLDSLETREWVQAEAQITEKYLEKIPTRKVLRERLTKLMDFEKFGTPSRRQDQYFYLYNKGLDPQSVLHTAKGLNGEPSALLDPNTFSSNGSVALAGYR